jgi:cytochrome c oxidase cbb3-type subunit 2
LVEGGDAVNRLAMRAALSVAAVYGFFLIFAQFSFVELLRGAGIGVDVERAVLGAMAAAGIAGGFLTAWRGVSPPRIRMALGVAALAAALAPLASGTAAFIAIALATGAALGVATAGLSALLPAWCGVVWVGVGTGLGYAFCNVPAVFLQTPAGQAWIGAGLAVTGGLALPSETVWKHSGGTKVFPFWSAVILFTALVWMDSAAFFIIQHAGDLKSGTWGESLLWRNAAVHLALACVAGWWLARGGAKSLPGTAWVLLAVAALMVNDGSTRGIAGWFYPAGVSLYSAALVAWPGWFSGARGVKAAAWRAAWLFAIAGWFGSANGIGMAETLERVPPLFVAAAGAAVAGVMFLSEMKRWRTVLAVAAVMLAGWSGGKTREPSVSSAAERGRQVYVSEGCIHCHSQYVRPGSADVEIWGPARRMEEILNGKPVLIGNRRQGPDLTNVGARRSEAWLKAHFIDPRAFAPDSPMPSYAHLFDDGRGEDLVRYLKLSGVSATADVMTRAAAWKPVRGSGQDARATGKALFATHCAVCHGDGGHGDGSLSGKFLRPPANLVDGPFIRTAPGADLELRTARVIKFGITGTDMPGHEVMTDAQVNALVEQVLNLRSCSGGL